MTTEKDFSKMSLEQLEKEQNSSKMPVEKVNQNHEKWNPVYQEFRTAVNKRNSKIAKLVKQELDFSDFEYRTYRKFDEKGNLTFDSKISAKFSPFLKAYLLKLNEKVQLSIEAKNKLNKRLK